MSKLLLSTAFVALSAFAAEASTITSVSSENSAIYSWGLPDTAAYGQTFTLSSAETINNVTFRIDDFGTAIAYNLYIYAWGGTNAVGSALTSTAGSTLGNAVMSTITTSANNVLLGAGQYVAFLEATSTGSARWGSVSGSDAYAGGAFVFQNNSGNLAQVTSAGWSSNWQGPGSDLAFAINGTTAAVPLPAGMPLLLAGIGGLAALRRRKSA